MQNFIVDYKNRKALREGAERTVGYVLELMEDAKTAKKKSEKKESLETAKVMLDRLFKAGIIV